MYHLVYLSVSSAFLAAMFCSNLTHARSLSLGVARMVARSGSVLAVRVYCTELYCTVPGGEGELGVAPQPRVLTHTSPRPAHSATRNMGLQNNSRVDAVVMDR